MKFDMTKIKRGFSKTGLKLKKASPEILVVAGVAGVITSTVLACKATLKVNDILEDTKEQLSNVENVLADPKITEETYSIEDSKKDKAIIYIQTGVKFVKLYGPAALLGAASITAIFSSHNILRKRNVALAAAYATIDKGFKEYRGRVVERFGEEIDHQLKYNIKAKEVETTTVDETGEQTTVKETIDIADPNTYSDYARFFDESCPGWCKDSEMNLYTLKCQQNYANEKLKANGYLFLNEVYDMLGIPRTKAGQVVGWVYDEKNPVGDNFVDFGMYDMNREAVRNFVNGHERSILLDFNVDGSIWDLMN